MKKESCLVFAFIAGALFADLTPQPSAPETAFYSRVSRLFAASPAETPSTAEWERTLYPLPDSEKLIESRGFASRS